MRKFLIVLLLIALLNSCSYGETLKSDRLFQVTLLQSLMQGEYDGIVTVGELKKYGDTGIGTFQDALKTDQREFSYENIEGTVVALYCSDYMNGLNTPGWHLHFISADGKKGGHVLTLTAKDCKTELDVIS